MIFSSPRRFIVPPERYCPKGRVSSLPFTEKMETVPAWGNPLWLQIAVEAVNLLDEEDFARAEKDYADETDPAARLQSLALDTVERLPGEVATLYGWVLERAEDLHGAAFVQTIVNLIAISRSGWREQDFVAVIPKVTLSELRKVSVDGPKGEIPGREPDSLLFLC